MARHNFDENPYAAPDADLATDISVETVEYAGFWRRFFALLIDGVLVNILFIVVFIPLMFTLVVPTKANEESLSTISSLLQTFINWLYFALQEASSAQATLGKRLLGIKVVDLSGNRISFLRATGRHFGKVISAVCLLIGFLMQPFTAKKQALHDIMAGTLVIKA